MSATTSRLRAAALVSTGSALLLVGLTACGSSFEAGTSASGDGGKDGFDISKTYSDHLASASAVTDEVEKGYLPKALPADAADIRYEASSKKTFASWKGNQAPIDGCEAAPSTKLPSFPADVKKDGSVSDIVECGSVHQATVGDYTYYWGPLAK